MRLLFLLIPTLIISCSTTKAPHYSKYEATPAISYKNKVLDFYSRRKPYGEFSNFALFPITVDDKLWPTSEHYYQAHKYDNPELQEWVRAAKSPLEAAKRGRDKSKPKRKDWRQTKDGFMEKALITKFKQYPELKELLLSTGECEIFEHTKNDCYWGDCGNRKGKNKLGKALMRLRKGFRTGQF